MKTTAKLLLTACAAMLAVSCDGVKKTKNGTEYILNNDKEGKNIKYGDNLIFNFKVYNSKDSLLQSSYEKGMPGAITLDSISFKGQMNEGLLMASEGDSITIFEPVDSILAKMGKDAKPMPGILPKTKLKYIIKVLNVYDKSQEAKFREKYMALQNAYMEKMSQSAMQEEPKKLEAYMSKNAGFEKMAEGYYVNKTQKTEGVQAKAGDKLKVHYTGYLLDGKKFDSSVDRNEPFEFEVGKGMVIPGWDLAFTQLKVGEKAKILLPSNLAYGPRQAGPDIKPFSPLVFEVELLEIVKK
jgi:FKBP-type peptidyl-prolyl cis-trans isomerase FkpA